MELKLGDLNAYIKYHITGVYAFNLNWFGDLYQIYQITELKPSPSSLLYAMNNN